MILFLCLNMSDLFDFIYEENDGLNLLNGNGYGDHIVVHKHYRELSKCIYYDHKMLDDDLYIYDIDSSCGDIDSCRGKNDGCYDYANIISIKVRIIKYNGIRYRFCKRNNIDEICLEYDKMYNGRKYIFIIHPIIPVYTLINGYEWNILMKYFMGEDLIKIWFNLRNGMSHVDSCDTYV